MNKRLETKLKSLPSSPGVYFHKDRSGEIIYVGKAAVLKNRVRQYFQNSRGFDNKTLALVNEIEDTDWVETESEIDALFLESEMVKRYMPRYNILLRDDKSQMFVRIDMKSEWPHVSFTRNPADDGAEYFGPYYNSYALKKALRYLRKSFPYYTKTPKPGDRPSLDAHLGLEPLGISSAEYKADLKKLVSYIKGNRVELARQLEYEMKHAAATQDFEKAARLRNRIQNLKELKRRIMFGDKEFLDISKDQALGDMVALLDLKKIPQRIEGYDISHMSGTNVVASMVVFTNGVSDRGEYRKFKTNEKNDDTGNLRDTLIRRLKHLKDWGKPDLVIIDGGLGQLSAVADVLNAENIPFIGRSKSGDHSRNASVQLVVPRDGKYEIVSLGSDSHVGKLIARIDDESHRFAVSYHTVLKRQRQITSKLEEIPGVGPESRRALLKVFGSVKAIGQASETEIAKVVGKKRAAQIKRFL